MADEKNVKRGPTEFSTYRKSADPVTQGNESPEKQIYDSIMAKRRTVFKKDGENKNAGNSNDD